MGKSSGGTIANNFRQGSRAEVLAQYILSEFCIAERTLKENDFGIDLYCSLMNKKASMGYTSTMFAVQIKTGDAPFRFCGDHAVNWLKMLNLPLIMCRVDQKRKSIKLYSTWTLNELLTKSTTFSELVFVENYSANKAEDVLEMPAEPKLPEKVATVWMGPPFAELTLSEMLDKPDLKEEFEDILKEWVTFDFLNYAKRHVGITAFFGYLTWTTNKSLKSSQRRWFKPHYFSDEQTKVAVDRILESVALIALNRPKNDQFVQSMALALKENQIKNVEELDKWHRQVVGLL